MKHNRCHFVFARGLRDFWMPSFHFFTFTSFHIVIIKTKFDAVAAKFLWFTFNMAIMQSVESQTASAVVHGSQI